MASFLYRIGRSAYLFRWRFIAAWMLLIVGVGTAAATLTQQTSTTFSIPGLESIETQEEMQERFAGAGSQLDAPTGTVVIGAPEGSTLTDPAVSEDVDAFLADLRELDFLAGTDALVSPVVAAEGLSEQLTAAKAEQGITEEQIAADIAALSPLSPDESTGTVEVRFDAESTMDVQAEDREAFAEVVAEHEGDLTIAYSGNAFQMSEISAVGEIIGIAVAAVILLVTFGSLIAAGMPLLTGVIGVGIGIGGIFAATAFTDTINTMTPTLASMIGLAVGIDYALFIVSRFRTELVKHIGGNDLEPAELAEKLKAIDAHKRAHLAGLAVGKAGSAVVFAGLTVLIALAALSIINIPFLTAMALSAAATVAIAVLVAITLLPAILGAVGTKLFAARIKGVKAPDPEDEKPTMGLAWVRRIRARPVLFAGAGVLLLLLLAIPAAQLRLAMPSDGTMAPDTPNRMAYDMTEEAFGPGRNAPMIALVDTLQVPEEERPAAWAAAVDQIQAFDGVENAQIIETNEAGDAAQVLITPEYGATDERAASVLEEIRSGAEGFEQETGGTYSVTGVTPIYEDISERLTEVLLPYVGIVLALAFVLLMLVFRSIWVPLIAALGFGLSVAATFGITVAIWQEGWLGIISDPQPVISFLPIMLIGIVFGLAMDYQVFLVSRMREGWVHGKTAHNAVANGFKHGARVVTAAALIMISVFAAFMLIDEQFIKVMGFALAVAVLFDAFVVRMTIIPAVMFLLGERAWGLPRWLDKILPTVDVEGSALETGQQESSAVASADGGEKARVDA
ncbi:MMPL family transporter [Dietzia maris]|jgi:RND superfamily putative drug exporter|uniref:MMPL family transporter n=1 Tax=Dietzia TaxID=37914 RepID=UPI0022B4F5CE|nr:MULTISPECIES: MMPL family transporter [Dietzia]MCZ4540568.1 MMPL family transporter [Dietzia maris]MCZ4656497.1 MMPL family transporter [Dietzia kunjamensis]MDV3357129.1 MMPL family transporter [Dietzia sp. IN118]